MTELKPCPFCGGKAILERSLPAGFDGEEWYYIYCSRAKESGGNKCPANPVISKSGDNAKERVIEAWNKRPNPWHTGTPTEDGDYVVICQYTMNNYMSRTRTIWTFKDGRWDNSLEQFISDFKVIAWYGQKIEPYKENEDGKNS